MIDEFSEAHVEEVYDVITHNDVASDSEFHVVSKSTSEVKAKLEGVPEVKICGVKYEGTAECLNECEQRIAVEAELKQELFETKKQLIFLKLKTNKMLSILKASTLFETTRGRISLKFQPGVLGLNLSVMNGKVCKVTGEQAISMGVQEGWQMTELDEEEYTEDLLAEKRKGSKPYMITFSTNAIPKDSAEDFKTFERLIADLHELYKGFSN